MKELVFFVFEGKCWMEMGPFRCSDIKLSLKLLSASEKLVVLCEFRYLL